MDMEQIIRKAALYIQQKYNEPITVADIAAHVYLSPSYFSSLFRAVTGYTAKNYLNRYRLCQAAGELHESHKQIIAIAYCHGFSSQQAFTKSFSQYYGISPAQFRLSHTPYEPFPPADLWKEKIYSMELMKCFENVRFIRKEVFFVAGVEVDISYSTEGGTAPIGKAWDLWLKESWTARLPDQTAPGTVYGITHSETENDTGKYIVCSEVSTLEHLPVCLAGRRFEACDFAIFDTTVSILWTGDFWRTFYTKWLPESGYDLPDEPLHANYCTFHSYPAIEVYDRDFKDDKSIIQIYAPVKRKKSIPMK